MLYFWSAIYVCEMVGRTYAHMEYMRATVCSIFAFGHNHVIICLTGLAHEYTDVHIWLIWSSDSLTSAYSTRNFEDFKYYRI